MAWLNDTLTIFQGQANSMVIDPVPMAPAISLWIGAPLDLVETVVLRTRRPGGIAVFDQQTNHADIFLTAGKATQITVLGGVEWFLHSTPDVADDRVFEIVVNHIGWSPIP